PRRWQRRARPGHLSTLPGMAEPAPDHARHLDREWLAQHLADERKEAEWLGEIREALFGMQDGLVSTLAVVSTVGAASGNRFAVLVAGSRPRRRGASRAPRGRR